MTQRIALILAIALASNFAWAQDSKEDPKGKVEIKGAKVAPAKAVAKPVIVKTAGKLVVAPKVAAPVKAAPEPIKAEPPKATPASQPVKAEPTPAPAPAPVVQQVWWQYLIQNLMELGFFLVTIMVSILIKVLAKKYKFQGDTDKIQDLVYKAIHFAEQKAISAAKLNPDAAKTPGAEKLKWARDFAVSMAKEYKLPEWGEGRWEDLLESALGMENVNNESFAKSVTEKVAANGKAEVKPA